MKLCINNINQNWVKNQRYRHKKLNILLFNDMINLKVKYKILMQTILNQMESHTKISSFTILDM